MALTIGSRRNGVVTLYARRIVKELRAVDPVGPYIIGGHSFGGVVGVEVAYQLEKAGCPGPRVCFCSTPARRVPNVKRIKRFLHERAFSPGA